MDEQHEAGTDFIPAGFTREAIGKTVSIQVFDRHYEQRGEIVPGSLRKYVGRLEMWYFEYGTLGFKLNGGELKIVDLEHHVVELYQGEEPSQMPHFGR